MAHLACLALLTGKNTSLSPGRGRELWRPPEKALENQLPSQSLPSTQASTDMDQVGTPSSGLGVATSPAIVLVVWQTPSSTQKRAWEIAVIHVASDFTNRESWEKEGSAGDAFTTQGGGMASLAPMLPTGMAWNSEPRSIFSTLRCKAPSAPASKSRA